MHLANGAITPECAAITFTAAAVGLGAAAFAARREPLSRQRLALAAGLGAVVLAAQAINVPILPGISAHLVGGALLAWTLGPSLGCLTMAAILAIQALAFGDGGLLALGANILNMALLPAGFVAVIQSRGAAESAFPRRAGERVWQPAIIAALSVPLAALLIAGEVALFRDSAELAGWQDFTSRLLTAHLWIGMAEGALTLALVAAWASLAQPSTWRPAIVAVAVACGLAACVPLSSELPDGYESAAEQSGLSHLLSE